MAGVSGLTGEAPERARGDMAWARAVMLMETVRPETESSGTGVSAVNGTSGLPQPHEQRVRAVREGEAGWHGQQVRVRVVGLGRTAIWPENEAIRVAVAQIGLGEQDFDRLALLGADAQYREALATGLSVCGLATAGPGRGTRRCSSPMVRMPVRFCGSKEMTVTRTIWLSAPR